MALMAFIISVMAFPVLAENHTWQTAKFISMEVSQGDGGTVIAPIGGMIAAIPVNRCAIVYTFATDKLIIRALKDCKHLNLTLHEDVKIFPLPQKLLVIDDARKQLKLDIVSKRLKD